MKEIIIFGSYCNTREKLLALERSITQAKLLDFDVLVFGRYPIPESTQRLCDYWIYDKSNPILADRTLNHWLLIKGVTGDKRISNWFQDYGYAALEQIIKCLGFVNNLDYEIAYWMVYDVDLTHFQSFRDQTINHLQTHQVVAHKFNYHSHDDPKGIDGTSIGFKVQPSYTKLKGVITETFYRDLISRREHFISEDFMEECFKVSELNVHILEQKPNLPATLTSTGVRAHGDIPDSFPKTKYYFNKCNIGWDEIENNVNVFIWGIKQPIEQIVFDFGVKHKTLTFIDPSHTRWEFNLDYKPTKCEVLEINKQPINEVLDSEFTDLYWELFKIKQE
jgi:hypothetical protein